MYISSYYIIYYIFLYYYNIACNFIPYTRWEQCTRECTRSSAYTMHCSRGRCNTIATSTTIMVPLLSLTPALACYLAALRIQSALHSDAETPFDVLATYMSEQEIRQAGGSTRVTDVSAMTAVNGPVARFLRECRACRHIQRVAFFLRFFSFDAVPGLSAEDSRWSSVASGENHAQLTLGALFYAITIMEMVRPHPTLLFNPRSKSTVMLFHVSVEGQAGRITDAAFIRVTEIIIFFWKVRTDFEQ